MIQRRLRALPALMLAGAAMMLVLAAACGGGGDEETPSPTAAATSADTSTQAASPTATSTAGASPTATATLAPATTPSGATATPTATATEAPAVTDPAAHTNAAFCEGLGRRVAGILREPLDSVEVPPGGCNFQWGDAVSAGLMYLPACPPEPAGSTKNPGWDQSYEKFVGELHSYSENSERLTSCLAEGGAWQLEVANPEWGGSSLNFFVYEVMGYVLEIPPLVTPAVGESIDADVCLALKEKLEQLVETPIEVVEGSPVGCTLRGTDGGMSAELVRLSACPPENARGDQAPRLEGVDGWVVISGSPKLTYCPAEGGAWQLRLAVSGWDPNSSMFAVALDGMTVVLQLR